MTKISSRDEAIEYIAREMKVSDERAEEVLVIQGECLSIGKDQRHDPNGLGCAFC